MPCPMGRGAMHREAMHWGIMHWSARVMSNLAEWLTGKEGRKEGASGGAQSGRCGLRNGGASGHRIQAKKNP
jgi:hypothetical protein